MGAIKRCSMPKVMAQFLLALRPAQLVLQFKLIAIAFAL